MKLGELRDLDVLVCTIPPEDRDWMLKGAVFARRVLLYPCFHLWLTKVGGIQPCHLWHNHSAHERDGHRLEHVHHPLDASILRQLKLKLKLKLASSPQPPPPPPSRTLLLLQSPSTRKHLTRIHAVSGGAVKLSNKASAIVERMIQHAAGSTDRGNGKGKSPSPFQHHRGQFILAFGSSHRQASAPAA